MDPAPLINRILDDEGLTAGLDEADALLLVRTVAERARAVAAGTRDPSDARRRVEELCRRARAVADVVATWRDRGDHEARACADRHGLTWPGHAESTGAVLRGLLEGLPG